MTHNSAVTLVLLTAVTASAAMDSITPPPSKRLGRPIPVQRVRFPSISANRRTPLRAYGVRVVERGRRVFGPNAFNVGSLALRQIGCLGNLGGTVKRGGTIAAETPSMGWL